MVVKHVKRPSIKNDVKKIMLVQDAKVDNEKVATETEAYQKIPEFTIFIAEDRANLMQQEIERNYYRIKEEAQQIVDSELARLREDPKFNGLVK